MNTGLAIASLIVSLFAVGASLWVYRWSNTVHNETVKLLAKIENSSDTISKEAFSMLREAIRRDISSSGITEEASDIGSDRRIKMLEEELAHKTTELHQARIQKDILINEINNFRKGNYINKRKVRRNILNQWERELQELTDEKSFNEHRIAELTERIDRIKKQEEAAATKSE